MAKEISAYRDNRGNLHMTAATAVVADIAAALGRVGDEGGLTNGVAALILEKRREIEQAFADYDALTQGDPSHALEVRRSRVKPSLGDCSKGNSHHSLSSP